MPQTVEVPGYGDVEFPDGMSDDQIAAAIRANMNVPAPKSQEPFPDVYGGAGGFNPVLSRLGGGAIAGGESLGMTPENMGSDLLNAAAPAEVAMQMGTSAAAMPLSGLAGIGQGVFNTLFPDPSNTSAADRVSKVQQALTYQPRGGAGAGMSRIANAPNEALQAGTNKAGEVVTDVTGMPSLGAAVKTLGDVAPGYLAARMGGASRPTPGPKGDYISTREAVPTTEALRAEKTATYKAADDANVVIKPASTQKAVDIFRSVAKTENLGELPTEMSKAVNILEERLKANEPLSLSDADKVRQRINDAMKSADPADMRMGALVKKRYDEYLDNLSANDVLSGNTAEGLALLKKARELNGRLKRSEMLDEMEALASLKAESNYTQAGHEHALRKQFEGLASRAIKGDEYLTPAQLAAVRKVAAPGAAANTLRNISKLDPARGGMSQGLNTIVGGGLGGALGSVLGPAGAGAGAIFGASTLGVGANLASRGALRGTLGRVKNAREALVGRNSSGGLLASDNPRTLVAESQGLLGNKPARAPATARTAAAIQADINRLTSRVQADLATEPAGSAKVKAAIAELRSLQRELAATQAN